MMAIVAKADALDKDAVNKVFNGEMGGWKGGGETGTHVCERGEGGGITRWEF